MDKIVQVRKNKQTIEYINTPFAFDTETTSYKLKEKKYAWVYEWTFGMGYENPEIIVGRNIEEFVEYCKYLSEKFSLGENKRIIVYVHNLMFDFQFFRKYFHFTEVFATDKRRVLYCVTDLGIEFRCSYLLSGYSLDTLAKNLTKHKIHKLKENMNYDKIRTPNTALTDEELEYCKTDVLILLYYIGELIEDYGSVAKLPYTMTGFARDYARERCQDTIKNIIPKLTIEDDEYKQLVKAFRGGFTHANAYYVGETLTNVHSCDFTSSYPAVMVSEKFPMSKGRKVKVKSKKELDKYLSSYCCLIELYAENVKVKEGKYEAPISSSGCSKREGAVINNGRIVKADKIIITMTDCDFKIFCNYYNWSGLKILNMWIYDKEYLPTDFVKCILKCYVDKTALKDVVGKETEYMHGKQILNAYFGMCVTAIEHPEVEYDENGVDDKTGRAKPWSKKEGSPKQITKYNKSRKRFLFYPWGVWIAAYARYNLFTAISNIGEDYVYCDTDSVKFLNYEKHAEYFEKYNASIRAKMQKAAEYHGVDFEMFEPKTIKGKKKMLGVWDDEGSYDMFKTLGAKRYLTLKDGKLNITVSGVAKDKGVKYLNEKFNGDINKIFNYFDVETFEVPAGSSGKQTHTYIDEESEITVIDCYGKQDTIRSLSGVYLEDASYCMSISSEFSEFLNIIKLNQSMGFGLGQLLKSYE